ncbi:MAG: twin-arginine translocase TatA/TatE family subunit [Planctomycetes bacterium]|nr:twin-arginine translocase TatA/TatE family subunit [Planctomycetota bacterium]
MSLAAAFFPLAFFQNIGMPELIIILIVALLIFGSRLPDVARKVGKGLSEFKRGVQEASDEVKREIDREPAAPPASDAASGAPKEAASKEAAAVKPEPPPLPPQSPPPPAGDANLN